MGIGNRIKEARLNLGYTQEELARLLGITKGAVANYEVGTSHPKEPIMYKLFDALHVDANYLFQDEMGSNYPMKVSYDEMERIKKCRFISEYSPENADMIDIAIDKGYSIAEQISKQKKQLSDQQDQIDMLKQRIVTEIVRRFCLPFYAGLASAGSGEYLFDDIPTDMIEVEDTPTARKADFVIGVNGGSMEPDFYDGEKVFVKKTAELNIGDVGIFIKGCDCYIKELGADRLISRNKDYKDIEADEEIRIVGRVIGKVGENQEEIRYEQ